MKDQKIGGINFISPEQRQQFDNELTKIAHGLLSITKVTANERMDYDYNCLIGAYRYRLEELSANVEKLRTDDILANIS